MPFLLTNSDNLVRVWRLYRHAEEALSLMMSFPAASVPSLMVATPERLCVACNNHQLSTYCIDMYNLSEQSMCARSSSDGAPLHNSACFNSSSHTHTHSHTQLPSRDSLNTATLIPSPLWMLLPSSSCLPPVDRMPPYGYGVKTITLSGQ